MATTPEGKVKAAARKLYTQHGATCFQNTASAMGSNGTPDQLVCRNDGHFGGIETKANTWKVSALQRIRLTAIAASNGSSMVVNERNLDMLSQWLQRPGTKVNAVFNDKDVCTHHEAYVVGYAPFRIENPGPVKKPGKV